jgi:outer membrane lipoprotein-sorting protein
VTGGRRLPLATFALLACLAPGAIAGESLVCTRTLLQKLAAAGRAEVRLVQTSESDAGVATQRASLALEAPQRLRLEYPSTGERIALRADGGEWLQPAARQMLILRGDRAENARALWRMLEAGGGERFSERPLGSGRFELVARGAGGSVPDSVWVDVGGDGLPTRLESRMGDVRWTMRFSAWRFGRARGRSAFVLRAPAGYETVEMP